MTQALAVIGIGATIAGGALSAKGAEQQGLAQARQNYYQAGIALLNQNIAKQNAEYALNQGEQEATAYGIQASQKMGAIVAAQGASGLDVHSGSARDVQVGQRKVQDMDMDTIRSNASKVALDYENQAVGFGQQAVLYNMAGSNVAVAGGINAQASEIGTVSSVANKWLQGSQSGLLTTSGISSSIGSIGTDISSGWSTVTSGAAKLGSFFGG